MERATKHTLTATLVVTLIAVMAYWYWAYERRRHEDYITLPALVRISYTPPVAPSGTCAPCRAGQECIRGACVVPPPLLSFEFARVVDNSALTRKGAMVVFKDFVPDSGLPPATAAAAAALVTALRTGGAAGGLPFVPVLAGPTTITSNTAPADAYGLFAGPASFSGRGTMLLTPGSKQ